MGSWQRRSLFARALWWSLPRLHYPVRFALLASLAAFALLLIMPSHPMAIPASFGGGLAIAILAPR